MKQRSRATPPTAADCAEVAAATAAVTRSEDSVEGFRPSLHLFRVSNVPSGARPPVVFK
jgi:hypothetical protein